MKPQPSCDRLKAVNAETAGGVAGCPSGLPVPRLRPGAKRNQLCPALKPPSPRPRGPNAPRQNSDLRPTGPRIPKPRARPWRVFRGPTCLTGPREPPRHNHPVLQVRPASCGTPAIRGCRADNSYPATPLGWHPDVPDRGFHAFAKALLGDLQPLPKTVSPPLPE